MSAISSCDLKEVCAERGLRLDFATDPLESRSSAPSGFSKADRTERGKRVRALASKYRSEFFD
jgi:hypothetical protein